MLRNFITRIKELFLKGAFHLGLDLLVFICILLSKLGFLEIIFGGIIIELCLNQLWSYRISMKEIFISHIYEKEGKEFNKEYYDLFGVHF